MVGSQRLAAITGLVGCLTLSASAADVPVTPQKVQYSGERLREIVQAGAEVHGVLVYEPCACQIGIKDVRDWSRLIAFLRAADGAGRRVRERLPKPVKELLDDDKKIEKLATLPPENPEVLVMRSCVTYRGLSQVVLDPGLYDEKAFEGVKLDKDLKAAYGKQRTLLQNARLNRALLSAILPEVIPEPPPDYLLKRVQVKAGRDVVLVLCSHEPCRWVVEIEKGAAVKGVVLYGYDPQELSGIGNVPVVYRAHYGPDGTTQTGQSGYPRAWDTGDEKTFKPFATSAKSVTGRAFTSVQGKYTAPKDGFVVRPGAK